MKRTPYEPTRKELADATRYTWLRVPPYKLVRSGRLVIKEGHWSYSHVLANDRVHWRLEDRLGHALERLEKRAVEAEARAVLERERAARRVEDWHNAKMVAVERYIEMFKRDALAKQIQDYRTARDIESFVNEVQANRDVDAATDAWLAWALSYAHAIDPVLADEVAPIPPEPTPDDLQPFMRGYDAWTPPR
jgi:hypothetical protein